jgi:glycosyltransferase involved in cell wall biosynthesis
VAKAGLNVAVVVPLAVRLRRWRCDLVYSNTAAVCVGAWAAKLIGRPHIWHLHEFGYEHHRLSFELGEKFSLKQMASLSDFCVAASGAVAERYQRYIPAAKLRVIYQSVGAPGKRDALPVDSGVKFRCVIVGALQEAKGQVEAIQAIAHLVRKGASVELWIVGDGDAAYVRRLQSLVTAGGTANAVKFTGFVHDPFPYMSACDAVLVCSRYEGFGRVTVEAMLCGKPVVAARSGATTELVREGFNGLLYSAGSHEELAERIEYLATHPEEAASMGERGREWATRSFSRERYGDEVLALLNAAVGRADARVGAAAASVEAER